MEKKTLTVVLLVLGGAILLCGGGAVMLGVLAFRTGKAQVARMDRQQALSSLATDVIVQMNLPCDDEAEFSARLDEATAPLFAELRPQDAAAVLYTFDGTTFQDGPATGTLSGTSRAYGLSTVPSTWGADTNGLTIQTEPFAMRTAHHVGTTVDGKPCLVLLIWELAD